MEGISSSSERKRTTLSLLRRRQQKNGQASQTNDLIALPLRLGSGWVEQAPPAQKSSSGEKSVNSIAMLKGKEKKTLATYASFPLGLLEPMHRRLWVVVNVNDNDKDGRLEPMSQSSLRKQYI